MAIFKPFRGNHTSLDAQPLHDGYAYFCIDDGTFHIDYVDADGNLQRKQLNAKDAETLGLHLPEEFLLKEELNLQKSHGDRTISTKPRINDQGEVKEAHAYQKDSIALAYKGQAGMTAEEFAEKYPSGKDDWGHTYEQSFGIAFAEGLESKALGRNSHAQNRATQALANDSSASGVESIASGINGSNANGFQTQASGSSSFTANYQTKATNQAASAFGVGGEASGKGAFKTGGNSTASGEYSFTEGVNTQAEGNHSHAQNRGTHAIADDSSASGVESVASGGNGSNANGFKTQATGTSSFTANDQTVASGNAASAFGSGGEASGEASFKTGKFNITSGAGSFSTGESNVSSRGNAFTEGQECRAEEWNAYAGGYKTHATTRHSFARGEGLRTVALNQTVFGKYNINDSAHYDGALPVLTVGYGTSDSDRKDVFNVLRDGRAIVPKTTSNPTDVVNVDYLNQSVGPLQEQIDGKVTIATFNITEENTTITLKNLTDMTKIDWGDGTVNSELSHTYVKVGEYVCKIYGATAFGDLAFSDCTSLTSVEIGDSTTSIGGMAFANCTSLTSVVIPNSVTSIDVFAFSACTSLTSVVIGNGVTIINDNTFSYCSSLTSVVIPDSVTSIESGAFASCTSLTNVVIPNSVTTIGERAFSACTSLTSVVIGNGVTSIGDGAFQSCSSLTRMIIPDSVTSIGNAAFYDCSSLTNVEISDSVTSIGSAAFRNCSGLTNVVIPDSVTSIGNAAFDYCSGLTSIVIPDSVTSIGYYAFEGCSSLTRVIFKNQVPIDYFTIFYECTSLTHIYVPYGCKQAYLGKWSVNGATEDILNLIVESDREAMMSDVNALREVIPTNIENGSGAGSLQQASYTQAGLHEDYKHYTLAYTYYVYDTVIGPITGNSLTALVTIAKLAADGIEITPVNIEAVMTAKTYEELREYFYGNSTNWKLPNDIRTLTHMGTDYESLLALYNDYKSNNSKLFTKRNSAEEVDNFVYESIDSVFGEYIEGNLEDNPNNANGTVSTALGSGNIVNSPFAMTVGYGNTVGEKGNPHESAAAHAFGYKLLATGIGTFVSGKNNTAKGESHFVGGGENNSINKGARSVIIGGEENEIDGTRCTIINGHNNIINETASGSTVLGGSSNIVNSSNSTVSGQNNEVSGNNSTALGYNLKINEGSYDQTVLGRWNQPNTDDLFQIGCGNKDDRKNAISVSSSGKVTVSDTVQASNLRADKDVFASKSLYTDSIKPYHTGDVKVEQNFISGDVNTHDIKSGSSAILGGNNNTIELDSHYSVILGGKNITISGQNSIASGQDNTVNSNNSAAFGCNLTTAGNDQFITCRWNQPRSDALFQVGCGSKDNPENAIEVLDSGEVRLSPNVVFGTEATIQNGKVSCEELRTNKISGYSSRAYPKGRITTESDFEHYGSTFVVNPAIGRNIYSADDRKIAIENDTLIFNSEKGAIFFDGAEVQQGRAYVVYATIDSLKGNPDGIGFAVGTLANVNAQHAMFIWRNSDIYVCRMANGDAWSWSGETSQACSKTHQPATLALVYKDGVYYMFIDGAKVFEWSETAVYQGWGAKIRDMVGTSGTIKLGLANLSSDAIFTSWGYSTDADEISEFLRTGEFLEKGVGLKNGSLYTNYIHPYTKDWVKIDGRIKSTTTPFEDDDLVTVAFMKQYIQNNFATLMQEYIANNSTSYNEIITTPEEVNK